MESSGLANRGKRPFSEAAIYGEERPTKHATISPQTGAELFNGLDREAFLGRHVHKKLHTQAAGLSDDELDQLGKLTFNQQFERFEPLAHSEMIENGDIFGGISRDEYLSGRVHRRLHAKVGDLSDMELLELGRMSFNQQFTYFGEGPPPSVGSSSMPSVSQQGFGNPFGNTNRSQFVQTRIHRKWHSHTANLSDEELAEIGKLSFNEQFPIFEQMAQNSDGKANGKGQSAVDFGVVGRDGYMTNRIHRKLHASAARLSDRDLLDLGRLNFNDQFPTIEKLMQGVQIDGGAHSHDASAVGQQLFGGAGRDGYMQQHVHRKLHAPASSLSDQDLFELGKLSFNDQFPYLGLDAHQQGTASHGDATDRFKGVGREGYMKQHIHRRLHHLAIALSDEGLFDLGRMSFKEQFPVLGQDPGSIDLGDDANPSSNTVLFDGLPREAYLDKHVHRKLQPHASTIPDDDLHALGKLTFNEQFRLLGQDAQAQAQAPPSKAPSGGPSVFTDAADRQAYIERRVHRKLHPHVANLSDRQLLEFGRRSFKDQFDDAGVSPSGLGSQQDSHGEVNFGGVTRDAYMQQRVHRKLHNKAANLRDNELLELGKLSFNDQFPFLEQFAELCDESGLNQDSQPDAGFGGLTRDAFMQQRVHRRLHPKAASLSDSELLELGKLKFNDQFPFLDQFSELCGESGLDQDGFGGLSRDAYMQQRVHRRLHPQAASLSDSDLLVLGRLKFNEQFPYLEQLTPPAP